MGFKIPTVSVVIPTYNRATRVQSAIESVFAQTFADLEVIVVDDGSTDDTGQVLAELFGEQIRYFAQSNQGASAARNKGISEARGEWIAFLDSDDHWEADKLEWQMKAIKRFGHECGGCYTDVRFFNHAETRSMFELAESSYRHEGEMGINCDVLRLLVRPGGAGMVVCPSSVLARTDAVRSTGFNPRIRYSEDSDFLFRLAMRTGFCYVNRPLVWFDRSPAELRHVGVAAEWNRQDFFLRNCQIRLEGLLGLKDSVPPRVKKVVQEELRNIHSGWVNWYLEAGEFGAARKAAWNAARTDLTLRVAAKGLLTWMHPKLALRKMLERQQNRKESII
jgi:glycosyltransferase involved in cell wall biosynthesis